MSAAQIIDLIVADKNIDPTFRTGCAIGQAFRSPRFIRGTTENDEFRAELRDDERLEARAEREDEGNEDHD